ncbi:P-loop containing nucleoside triphosphate hydrolase protein [Rickenella mellea]|uniref:P-loop containing nucleoside triphosphate hydrolase protein n=1 Tax=Rickenella mellea TaxID=50990 RepID=A0A4Y7PRI7_9AGAM|nr:P-loop containing nucleoside triphosphate hydrolase protein [Rickenella mellea]
MTPTSDVQPTLIAVVGHTGAGKSSFINTVSNHKLPVGAGLDSCTKKIQEVRLKWGKEQKPVVIVDTPGFGDSDNLEVTRDIEVFKLIQSYLVKSHKAGTKLSGIIYTHRISDSKVEGGTRRNLRTFQELCGSEKLHRVVILTTWWDKEEEAKAVSREKQLSGRETLFKPMVELGAKMMRHDKGFSSAQMVLNHLLQLNAVDLGIQEKPVRDETPEDGLDINLDLQDKLRHCLDSVAAKKGELKNARDDATRRSLKEDIRKLEKDEKKIRKKIQNERSSFCLVA